MSAIFNKYGYARTAHSNAVTVFSGRDVYTTLSDKTTWSIFLKHMAVLSSDRIRCLSVVTPCESNFDANGGEYRINYQGIIHLIAEEMIANFIEVSVVNIS